MASADPASTPERLLDEADRLLGTVRPGTRGLWPRATAFLIRLALEQVVDDFWQSRQPEMRSCSMRAKLVCLRDYTDGALAGRIHAAWGALSSACHYHAYAFAPTVSELRAWLTEVRNLGAAMGKTRTA